MSKQASEDPLDRLRAVLGFFGLAEKPKAPAEPSSSADDEAADLREALQKIRDLLQKFGAALGAGAAAIMAGLGYTQLHKIFPLPAHWSWLYLLLALAASASALGGAAWLAARFFAAQRRIVIDTEWEDDPFTNAERKVIRPAVKDTAAEHEARTLLDLELRAQRFSRIARRVNDKAEKEQFERQAEQLTGAIRLSLLRAVVRVLEHRANDAFRGRDTKVAMALTIAGIISVFGLADWSQGKRDLIGLRKSCAEAQKAGAVDACKDVVPKKAQALYPLAEPGTPWLNSYVQRKLKRPRITYRVYGSGSKRRGQWVASTAPENAKTARANLALPPANSAACLVEVSLPAGTAVRIGHVGPAFGQPGGSEQIEIVRARKAVTYSSDQPLAPNDGPCP